MNPTRYPGPFSSLREAIFTRVGHQAEESSLPARPLMFAVAGGKDQSLGSSSNISRASEVADRTDRLTSSQIATRLDTLEATNAKALDWRSSIADLMELVGIDCSHESRRDLALELGYSQKYIDTKGSAEMNRWLHGRVLSELSKDAEGDLLAR